MWYSLHSFLKRANSSDFRDLGPLLAESRSYWLSLAAFKSFTIGIENRRIGFECLRIRVEMDVTRSWHILASGANYWRCVLVLLAEKIDYELKNCAFTSTCEITISTVLPPIDEAYLFDPQKTPSLGNENPW